MVDGLVPVEEVRLRRRRELHLGRFRAEAESDDDLLFTEFGHDAGAHALRSGLGSAERTGVERGVQVRPESGDKGAIQARIDAPQIDRPLAEKRLAVLGPI